MNPGVSVAFRQRLGRTILPKSTVFRRSSNNFDKETFCVQSSNKATELPTTHNFGNPKTNASTNDFSQSAGAATTNLQFHPRFGPMDPVSNIRPVHFDLKPELTNLERKYRLLYIDTWKWLDRYWASHNMKLMLAKREFLESQSKSSEHSAPVLKSDRNSPDLSDFYAQFLEDSRKSHVQFNL
ncbi:hypothetical protein FBUS_02812 [Fasciolopsis buskii]|uniref:APOPT family protein CG14806, mitochondrial n=1 Tax=Fasciolopsis buskii TaxID=27845 RepID=A0A8E0RV14_9TREM|nr:hypothetical protein FBUS_02812 [Fasciolopsis buski]